MLSHQSNAALHNYFCCLIENITHAGIQAIFVVVVVWSVSNETLKEKSESVQLPF